MNNIRSFPSRNDDRVEMAADWIAAIERGITEKEEAELGQWLRIDDDNLRCFLELAELWDDMDALGRLSALFAEPKPRLRLNRAIVGWSVAATLIFALTFIFYGQWSQEIADPTNAVVDYEVAIYETALGEQASYVLADGSSIVLNTNTLARVEFTPRNRKIFLERGEVHIRVAHDTSRRLSVFVGERVVQAVGTEFNVEITTDNDIELVVTEGIVMVGVVEKREDVGAEESPVLLAQTSTLVGAGKEATFSGDSAEEPDLITEEIEVEDIAVKLSWREGNLIFRGESLEEAVTEVGRYTAVEFVFVDERAKKVRVAGLFKAGDVEGLLAALRIHFNITYEWRDDETILLSAEK